MVRGAPRSTAESPETPISLFRLSVERLDIVVRDRPVDALSVERLQPEVVRHQPQAGPEPMPGRAAHHLDIGARELVRPGLPVPEVEVARDRVHRLRHRRIGALRHLIDRVPVALARPACRSTFAPASRIATLTPGAASFDAMIGAGYARADDDHVGGDVVCHASSSRRGRIRPVAGLAAAFAPTAW